MKTTIDVPDELAAEARDVARSQGTTLRELVVDGLRRELDRRQVTPPDDPFVFPTFEGGSGLAPGLEWKDVIAMSYGLPPE